MRSGTSSESHCWEPSGSSVFEVRARTRATPLRTLGGLSFLKGAGFSSGNGFGRKGLHVCRAAWKVRASKGPKTAASGRRPIRSGCVEKYSKRPDFVERRLSGFRYSSSAVTKAACMPRNGSIARIAAKAMSEASEPSEATNTMRLALSAPFRIMSLVIWKNAEYSPATSYSSRVGHA